MQYRGITRTTLLALGMVLAAQTGLAQPARQILVDIAPCVGLASAVERLDCYDRLGRVAGQAEPAADSNLPAAAVPPASALTPEPLAQAAAAPEAESPEAQVTEFGRNSPAAEARVLVNAEGGQELLDEIVELRERVPGRWLITLASGQVWYQDNSQRMRLRKGMQVRIYPSPLGGAWRMARADGGQSGFIQVSRIE
jgi:hypothetical protein